MQILTGCGALILEPAFECVSPERRESGCQNPEQLLQSEFLEQPLGVLERQLSLLRSSEGHLDVRRNSAEDKAVRVFCKC